MVKGMKMNWNDLLNGKGKGKEKRENSKKENKMKIFSCPICNKRINWYTAVIVSHLRKHVKEGTAKEEHKGNNIVFTTNSGEVIKHSYSEDSPTQKPQEQKKPANTTTEPVARAASMANKKPAETQFICPVCKKALPRYTAIIFSHLRKHVKEGQLKEVENNGTKSFINNSGKTISLN